MKLKTKICPKCKCKGEMQLINKNNHGRFYHCSNCGIVSLEAK